MVALILGVVMQAASIFQGAQLAMLADINATRAHAGLPALQIDQRLTEVATEHAVDMVQRHYFDHNSPEGVDPFQRMRRDDVTFSWAGENLALATSESQAYNALVHSPHHLENILQPNFGHVGIAAVREPSGDIMFVQEFTN